MLNFKVIEVVKFVNGHFLNGYLVKVYLDIEPYGKRWFSLREACNPSTAMYPATAQDMESELYPTGDEAIKAFKKVKKTLYEKWRNQCV